MAEIKTIKVSSKRQISIPTAFTLIKENEKAYLIMKEHEIIIRPVPKNISDTALMSEQALSECWDSPEDEKAFSYLQ